MQVKTRNNYIDLLRAVFCLAVLFYHLDILKGGYLAVNSFFVMAGYLGAKSLFKKDKINLFDYYATRLKRLYLPLVAVTFISVGVISLIKSIIWISLRPETISVLFGYNNFWQISASLDYFARHTDSPFMHFWYIAILLQFTVILPILVILYKWLKSKTSNNIAGNIMFVLPATLSLYYMGHLISSGESSAAYYNTFSRVFALLYGCAIGLEPILSEKLKNKKSYAKLIFWGCLVISVCMFVLIKPESTLYFPSMAVSVLITLLAMESATALENDFNGFIEKIVFFISDLSYEVYLVQYPIIFIAQYIIPDAGVLVTSSVVIVLSFVLAYILNGSINLKFRRKLSIVLLAVVIASSGFGVLEVSLAKDHTQEMKDLEAELEENQRLMEERQQAYAENMAQQKLELERLLQEIALGEASAKEAVTNLFISAYGDSVLLGASYDLCERFPNMYCDAQKNRTGWAILPIIKADKEAGNLNSIVLINIGANGAAPQHVMDDIMATCGDAEVFWVTCTNDASVHANSKIRAIAESYSNAHCIDWEVISSGHPEYFGTDGIHLTTKGRTAYGEAVFNALYEVYVERINKAAEEALKEHEAILNSSIAVYGDDLVVNLFDNLGEGFENAGLYANKFNDFSTLYAELNTQQVEGNLAHNLVFGYSSDIFSNPEWFALLMKLCENNKVYILKTDDTEYAQFDNLIVIDFSAELKAHSEYMLADRVHLSNEGDQALALKLKEAMIAE